jgi:hypothetical protein
VVLLMMALTALTGCGASTCEYDGETFVEGDSFPSDDGCNTCTCEADGSVACTDMGCIDDTDP